MKKNWATKNYLVKKQKSNFSIFIAVLMIVVSYTAKAQTIEAGAFVGSAYYLGDFNPKKHFSENDLAYGGVLKYNLNKRWTIGLAITQGNIKSDATTYNTEHPLLAPEENLTAQINELALLGELNFFSYTIGDRKSLWTPYIFGGAAYFLSTNTDSYSFPFGLGFKVNPINRLGLNLFWGARKTFTDDLDNVVSLDYQGYNGDWYIFYGLNITFAFHLRKDNNCRNIINRKYN